MAIETVFNNSTEATTVSVNLAMIILATIGSFFGTIIASVTTVFGAYFKIMNEVKALIKPIQEDVEKIRENYVSCDHCTLQHKTLSEDIKEIKDNNKIVAEDIKTLIRLTEKRSSN